MQVSASDLLPGIQTCDDLVANNNVAILGPTGSGKSVLSDDFFDRLAGRRVFFNPEEEPKRNCAHVRRDPREIRKIIAAGHRRIEFTPPPNIDAMCASLVGLKDQLFAIGDRLRHGKAKTDHWVTFFGAEAQLYSPKEDKDGPLPDMQRRGRKRGIRCVVDTQEPAAVSHTVLKQSTVKCLFQFDPIEMEYFRRYSVPIDEFQDHVARPHHWVMVKGSRWVPYAPVPFRG